MAPAAAARTAAPAARRTPSRIRVTGIPAPPGASESRVRHIRVKRAAHWPHRDRDARRPFCQVASDSEPDRPGAAMTDCIGLAALAR